MNKIDFSKPMETVPSGLYDIEYVGPSIVRGEYMCRIRRNSAGKPGKIRRVDEFGRACGSNDSFKGEIVLRNKVEAGEPRLTCYAGPSSATASQAMPIDWTAPLETVDGEAVEFLRANNCELYPRWVRVHLNRLRENDTKDITVTEDGCEYSSGLTGIRIRNKVRNTNTKVDWTKPIKTVDDRPATFLGFIGGSVLAGKRAIVVFKTNADYEVSRTYSLDGDYVGCADFDIPTIINVPVTPKEEVSYTVEYKDNSGQTCEGPAWSSEQAALQQVLREANEKVNQVFNKRTIRRYVNGVRDTSFERVKDHWTLIKI